MIWVKRKRDGAVGYRVDGNECKFPDSYVSNYRPDEVEQSPNFKIGDAVLYGDDEKATVIHTDWFKPEITIRLDNGDPVIVDRFRCHAARHAPKPGDTVSYRGQIGTMITITGDSGAYNGFRSGDAIYVVDEKELTFVSKTTFEIGQEVESHGHRGKILRIEGGKALIDFGDVKLHRALHLVSVPKAPLPPIKPGDIVKVKVDGRQVTVRSVGSSHINVTVACGEGKYDVLSLHPDEVTR